jgi:hypothetical protein
MRSRSSRLFGDYPIKRDSHETDGILGTEIVRRKTDEICDGRALFGGSG